MVVGWKESAPFLSVKTNVRAVSVDIHAVGSWAMESSLTHGEVEAHRHESDDREIAAGRVPMTRASTAGSDTCSWPWLFESLSAPWKLTAALSQNYGHPRPHSSLGCVAPIELVGRSVARVSASPERERWRQYPDGFITLGSRMVAWLRWCRIAARGLKKWVVGGGRNYENYFPGN